MSDILSGFEIVPSDNVPALTLDNQLRIYLNTSARRLLDLRPYDRISLAYRADTGELALIKAGNLALGKRESAELLASNFVVDKRYYLHTRRLARNYGFKSSGAPYHFEYQRGASDGSVFIFRLT